MAAPLPIDDIAKLVQSITPAAAVKLAHAARTHLVVSAQRELKTSARDYIAGISDVKVMPIPGGVEARVVLNGALANMVERGVSAFDMRPGLLASPKAKTTSKGYRVLAVPFRHMGPNASGRNAAPMGSGYSEERGEKSLRQPGPKSAKEADALGREVWGRAKRLSATRSRPGGGTDYGGRLEDREGPMRGRHAGGLYGGMIREEKAYQGTTQSQYITFRMVSSNPATFRSDEGGMNWTHPGIVARNLFTKAERYILDLIQSGRF